MNRPPESDVIYGRWPVKEALEAGPVSKILISDGMQSGAVKEIVALARKQKVPFKWVERRKLDQMVKGNHQGLVAFVSPLELGSYKALLEKASQDKTPGPSIIYLDGIQDPQNVGSIIRSAVFFNVQGIVLPKWRSAPPTGAVMRASAGAARNIDIVRVTNLATAMQEARKKGIWLVGADMAGESVKGFSVPSPFALIMGSEGEGLHRLVKENCDFVVRIPTGAGKPGVDSLNVGVAAGILLSHLSS